MRDAEIRVYNHDSGSALDDASDMYVMEVLGVSLLIRARQGDTNDPDNPDSLFVHIDNEDRESCTLAVEVCNGGETECIKFDAPALTARRLSRPRRSAQTTHAHTPCL